MLKYHLSVNHGEVSEWFKELVLKTSDSQEPRVRIPSSPPPLFSQFDIQDRLITAPDFVYMEKYSSW